MLQLIRMAAWKVEVAAVRLVVDFFGSGG